MDAEIAQALRRLPELSYLNPVETREQLALLRSGVPGRADPHVQVGDHAVQRDDGTYLPVRSYRPAGASPGIPVVMWFHGGGFCIGNVDVDDAYCAELCLSTQAVVVSVEYRLAPEHPFPNGLEDCYSATAWAVDRSASLGGDGSRLAVAGGSAGGGLAAAVALLCRDRSGPPLAFQLLLYPALDDRAPRETRVTTRRTNVIALEDHAAIWSHYLGPDPSEVSPYAAPARAGNLGDLPPAYVLVAGRDFLRHEGARYAQRLDEAGVEVELHLVPDVPHGFDALALEAPTSRRIRAEYGAAVARALGR